MIKKLISFFQKDAVLTVSFFLVWHGAYPS